MLYVAPVSSTNALNSPAFLGFCVCLYPCFSRYVRIKEPSNFKLWKYIDLLKDVSISLKKSSILPPIFGYLSEPIFASP